MSNPPKMLSEVKQNISQVAFCCHNASALRQWYQQVFQLEFAGRTIFGTKIAERVQGIAGSLNKCYWLLDSQQHFQLEFFEFIKPKSKSKSADWSIADIGYNLLSMVVQDFDGVIARATEYKGEIVSSTTGELGERQVVVKDIEANYLLISESELHPSPEQAKRPEVPVTVRRMTVVVPDLKRAIAHWQNGIGLTKVAKKDAPSSAFSELFDSALYQSQHMASSNFLIELVEHKDAKPRPDGYQICDIGFMNVAVGLFDSEGYNQRFYHAVNTGYVPNGRIADPGVFKVMYINDPDHFSVEMLYARRWAWGLTGFSPSNPYVENEITINAPQAAVWQAFSDHANMGSWSIFDSRLKEAGAEDENGVGAVRELTLFGSKIIEEVVDYAPEKYLSYTLRKGAPFSRHLGQIYLTPTDDGVKVRWVIRFSSKILGSGKLTALILEKVFARDLRKLKKQLETATHS